MDSNYPSSIYEFNFQHGSANNTRELSEIRHCYLIISTERQDICILHQYIKLINILNGYYVRKKSKEQSRTDNPETQVTVGTHDTGRRKTKQTIQ